VVRGCDKGLIRSYGWAFFLVISWCNVFTALASAWHGDSSHGSVRVEQNSHEHVHSGTSAPRALEWEGSPEGKAYSEFNHHVAGVFVILIGLSELREALACSRFTWSRFLLPVAMSAAGGFLLIWSDHEAWPVGPLGFAQTFFGDDKEIVQHKTYGLLLLGVGVIELLRRFGRLAHEAWMVPLPALAIIGGLLLFGHEHGAHPFAQKIAVHHTVMGILAITAGSSKLVSGWQGQQRGGNILRTGGRLSWELAWAGLVLLIGLQLLLYAE
jgi:hypothetical protein